MNVFDRVKNLCFSKGISLTKMEKEIGLSKGASYKWKTSSPSMEVLNKLSNFFNVSIEYLTTGKESKFTTEMADLDGKLFFLDKEIKEYAIKISHLSNKKIKHIFSLIDILSEN